MLHQRLDRSRIEAKGLCQVYRRGREEIQALKNVDFCLEAGEFVSIIGPSSKLLAA